mmetsp:Transcript_55333/g.165903  ORF Transcript_55333/g.165903 Transcript_55333/m.165903 type:complete len:227 (-) Transcript_55333:195-875(-)
MSLESMRFPKYFQPVGVSNRSNPRSLATRSTAPEVGMERATPLRPPWAAKKGMASAYAAIIARESDGVTKNWDPRIMFLSPSPSAAAPKEGIALSPVSIFWPFLSRPMMATSSFAYVRLGSACPPLKSSFGVALRQVDSDWLSSSTKTALALGPFTPCMESYTMEKSSRSRRALMAGKSKMVLRRATCTAVESMTSTLTSVVPSALFTVTFPAAVMSTTGNFVHIL